MTAPAAGGGDTRDGRAHFCSDLNPDCRDSVPARPAAAPADDTGEMVTRVEDVDAAVERIAAQYRDPTLARFAINDFRDWQATLPAVRDLTDGRRTDRAKIAAVEALAAWAKRSDRRVQGRGYVHVDELSRALGGER